MTPLMQTRDITCGCGRNLRVPVLGDVMSLCRESIIEEQLRETELLLKMAYDEIRDARRLLTDIRADAQCAHWHKDIDAAMKAE